MARYRRLSVTVDCGEVIGHCLSSSHAMHSVMYRHLRAWPRAGFTCMLQSSIAGGAPSLM